MATKGSHLIFVIIIFLYSCSGNQGKFPESVPDLKERLSLDFSLSEQEIIQKLEKLSVPVTEQDIRHWEENKWLEYTIINGEKKYFNRAASNLLLLKKFYKDKEARFLEISNDPVMIVRKEHTERVIKESGRNYKPVLPVEMRIMYTITVNADAVPDGEIIRCWMPWPKGNHLRQEPPELITASEPGYIISADSSLHRTIYMEKIAVKGQPAIFNISMIHRSAGQYYNPDSMIILPYDKNSPIYKIYTGEEKPHICFTDNVKKLADSLVNSDDDPVASVRNIYMWFKENIPWTGALEYSIMPNIPEYVLKHRRGDCGMQTFLFMSLLRYKGIPVRWQSGWMVPPGAENLHDWCEVWFEGTGWVPVDISYDLQYSENPSVRDFYMSGIDSYRMIVNDGVAGDLFPPKMHIRSEPFDFQRGELEWKGGNLYFDKWDYEMDIEYLNSPENTIAK